MYRNVTAIYRTRPTADLVCRGLEEMGISRSAIHVVPDRDHPVAGGALREDTDYTDRLHDLHLPEDDLRTYQQCVRRGDYVVSAEVEDRDIDRVKAIMRRPEEETYHFENRASEFGNETIIPHSAGDGRMLDEEGRAQRLAAHDDPYARTYERRAPLRGAQRSA
jgi:hypothetical protein